MMVKVIKKELRKIYRKVVKQGKRIAKTLAKQELYKYILGIIGLIISKYILTYVYNFYNYGKTYTLSQVDNVKYVFNNVMNFNFSAISSQNLYSILLFISIIFISFKIIQYTIINDKKIKRNVKSIVKIYILNNFTKLN